MKWKRIIVWVLAGLVALALVGIVGGLAILRSSRFQNYALRKIAKQVRVATGAATEIRGFDFSLSPATAHLYHITMRGTERPTERPLLQVDKLTVSFKIQSALHRQIALREILIEHPVAHLETDRAGRSNFPQVAPSQSHSQISVFDLAVGHVRLTHGEVNYNDQKIPLDADLYNLGTEVHFDRLTNRYSGAVSYAGGHLRYADYSSLPHKLSVKFSATPERFTLEPAVLTVGASEVVLHAGLSGYSNPVADGDYEVRIRAQDIAALSPSVRPAGDLMLTGKLHYQAAGKKPSLRGISVNGQVASEALTAFVSGTKFELRKLQGRYQLANGTLRMRDISLQTLGGTISTAAEIEHLDATPSSRVRAALHGISLRAVQQVLHRRELKGTAVSGALNGTADASWSGSISDARVRADLTVTPTARGVSNSSAADIPVDGVIHTVYDGSRNSLAFKDCVLRAWSTTLTAQGEISDHSSLQIQMSAKDLHQLVTLAASVRPGPSTVPAVSGSASLNGVVRGSMHEPEIAGHLSAQNLRVQGSAWSAANIDIQASPSQFTVRNGVLINAHKGQASFDATVGLQQWSYQPSSPVQARLSARGLEVRDLQRLANQHYPVSGELSARLSVQGSQLDPKGSGSAQMANVRAYDELIQDLSLKFNAANGSIASTLNLTPRPARSLRKCPTPRKPGPTECDSMLLQSFCNIFGPCRQAS